MNGVYKWYNFNTCGLEFDPAKSHSNMNKHGIDFVEAQQLWEDPGRLVVSARTENEPRGLLVGRIADRHWSAVFSLRGDRIWIISVRRARQKEISRYEDHGAGIRRKV